MATVFYPINSPLINYFFYKAPLTQNGPNIPLAGGKLFFYADEDHTLELPTYSDVSDPNNPVINTDPITLGAVGDCPLFYLDDRFYYIVITDSSGDQQNPITTISHYNPANNGNNMNDFFNNNMIDNGQFTYPIEFWEDGEEEGTIPDSKTTVAWAWEFLQDDDTQTKNFVTFNDVTDQNIEGNPINEMVLESQNIQSGESVKDFRTQIGDVTFFENSQLTLSLQLQNKQEGNVSVGVYLESFYGLDGSPTQITLLTSFTATQTRTKFIYTLTMPDLTDEEIGEGNYSALRFRVGLGQLCEVGMTNVLLQPGNVTTPVYAQEAVGDAKAQIIGSATLIEEAGLMQNYSPYYYTDGNIVPLADTGAIVLVPNVTPQTFREKCDGATRKVSDYSAARIPYRRLYNAIGNTFAGTGSLIVTSASNVVTFSSGEGARQHSDYTAGTTSFTVTNTVPGLAFGIKLTKTEFNQLTAEWMDDFAPDQVPNAGLGQIPPPNGLMGFWASGVIPADQLSFTTVDPGSGSAHAIAELNFNNEDPSQYETRLVNSIATVISWIDFASFTNNTRGSGLNVNYMVCISVDGAFRYPINIGSQKVIVVPFQSRLSLSSNLDIFARTVANPFQWTITVTAAPAASNYFLYSDESNDLYAYFVVDGVGVDPMIVGRTGTAINTSSTDTTTIVAQKIAAALDDLSFSLPNVDDLPDLQPDSKVSWFINL